MGTNDLISDTMATRVVDELELAAERIITGVLPIPIRTRWQPLRLGLMNVFLFEDERFPFADGRLLLRGNNGAGKSRVLAMTLPLLLDGSFSANRVEPDRDPNRQVAWNLLMEDQDSRTGYSWLELGRADAPSVEGNGSSARPQYLTIGCGMKAVRGQPIKPWYFITDLRIDKEFDLKTPDGVPLTQRQLTELLANRGQVVDRAQDYRRLVDEKLFRLGERYDPLIDLLLQLRQPQLAKKLDLDQLEAALRAALPPLPEGLLEDAAEAFRDLDQYRAGLAAERQTLEDVKKFTRPYREHVRRGTLRAAKRLTRANSDYEKAQRQQRQAMEELELKQKTLHEEEIRQHELRLELAAATAAIEALRNRPEMQDVTRIEQLRESIRRQGEELNDIQQDLERASSEQQAASDKIERAATEQNEIQEAAEAASANAAASAAPDALVNRHRDLTKPLLLDGMFEASELEAAQSKLLAEIRHWQKSAAHLADRNRDVAAAATSLRDAKRDTDRAKDQVDRVAEELDGAESREDAEVARLWNAIVEWFRSDSPLQPHLPMLGTFSDSWHRWAETVSGNDPLDDAVTSAQRQVEQRFANEESALNHQIQEQQSRDKLLAVEEQKLNEGLPIEPPIPYTRDETDRQQRTTGAPFWQLVDFVEGIPESERGDWEAALQAAGLLDAWLSADGRLLDAKRHDTHLVIGDEPALPVERQLCRVLRVATNCQSFGVPAEVVQAVLTVIGVGADAGRIWLDRDGRWRNGPLYGRWSKSQAQFIGETARTRWRMARQAEIANERAAIQSAISEVQARLQQLEANRSRAAEHCRRAPSRTELVQHRAETNVKQVELDRTMQRHRECNLIEQQSRDRLGELSRLRDQDAADVGLTGWVEKLDELSKRLTDYDAKLQVFWAKLDNLAAASRRSEETRQRLHDAAEHRQILQQRFVNKKLEVTKEEATFRELEAASGQLVAEIMSRLDAQRHLKEDLDQRLELRQQQIIELGKGIAVVDSQLRFFEETSQKCDDERRDAAEWFGAIGAQGLIEFAVDDLDAPAPPWSMTQAIKVARTTDTSLADVRIDDDTWQQSQNRVHEAHSSLQQTILSQEGIGTDVDHLRDGLQLVTITLQGDRMSLASSLVRLEDGVAERDRILDEKEQETLEKYLLGEVADGLRRRMKLAAELVELMTREVSKRPMKTGMQLRFKWQRDPDGPPGLMEACDVLQTVSATWSPDEREQIKQFLQRRIRVQRDSDLAGSWHEHLREAMDYRAWYRIEISRRSGPDSEWQKLTRRTYGSGSGGEKAIALTLPQLAAAAAYYQTADKNAPRFILLDEAFAGISPDMRESCLELIAAFDLDVVMTSESEWGCYAAVPQLAISQLDRFAGINAVVNRLYVWNGKQRREVVGPNLGTARKPSRE